MSLGVAEKVTLIVEQTQWTRHPRPVYVSWMTALFFQQPLSMSRFLLPTKRQHITCAKYGSRLSCLNLLITEELVDTPCRPC